MAFQANQIRFRYENPYGNLRSGSGDAAACLAHSGTLEAARAGNFSESPSVFDVASLRIQPIQFFLTHEPRLFQHGGRENKKMAEWLKCQLQHSI